MDVHEDYFNYASKVRPATALAIVSQSVEAVGWPIGPMPPVNVRCQNF
jgi:hypothetical protein